MKKVAITLRFKSACLGHIARDEGYFAFPRDENGHIMLMQSWLRAALRKAIAQMNITDATEKTLSQRILLETKCIDCSDVTTKDMPQGRKITYDCIPVGTQLTINCLIPFGIPPEKVEAIFTCVGDWIGLSPRHAGEGYGRFEITNFQWENPL